MNIDEYFPRAEFYCPRRNHGNATDGLGNRLHLSIRHIFGGHNSLKTTN